MARETAGMDLALTLFETNPLVPIRNETVLTRYPVHRLGKHGDGVSFEIREKSETEKGRQNVKWQVSYNSKYGEPGPLAYKIDTIIINRRIDEARDQGLVPSLIKLGSLREIAREVGTGDANTSAVKQALLQNASAFIVTDQDYIDREGKKQSIKLASTRYAAIFIGQALPDGRKADAVYIRLQEDYLALLNSARNRPLDYDYLKDLTPGPQRLYELLSFEIYAALKRQAGSRAKLVYSEYCLHAPQKRYLLGNRMRMQMKELHAPHIASGYINDNVEYVETTDDEGNTDWEIFYTPGRKALAEFIQFNTKGNRVVEAHRAEVQQAKQERKEMTATPKQLALPEAKPEPDPEHEALVKDLTARGLAIHRANDLLSDKEIPDLRLAIRHFDYKMQRGDKIRDAGALLADMIARPDKYVTPENLPDPKREAARKAEKKAAQAADEGRIDQLAERLHTLYSRMQNEESDTFAGFLGHIEQEREKLMALPMFKSRSAEVKRAMLASFDEDKGRAKHFLAYFTVHECPLPELTTFISGTTEADINRVLDRFDVTR